MSEWIDDEYATYYFMSLRNYRQVASSPMRLNASCPVCGDSAKDQYKARFWYYHFEGATFVNCYNCNYTTGFSNHLREYDPEAFKQMTMEKFRNTNPYEKQNFKQSVAEPSEQIKAVMPTIQKLEFCDRLDTLPEAHPIIKYVNDRAIPKSAHKRLWFTCNWQELCNSVKPGTFEHPRQEYRLVIPIFNIEGEIESFQGRALKESKIKYMTIKAHDDATKIYGCDTVDDSKDYVLVMEGPIDSLFIENSIAITGGSLNLDRIPYADKRIWVMDNEPRHPDTIKRMHRLIEAGEKVCFWENAPWKSKDINDMVAKEGAKPSEILEYISLNSESGMMATLRMAQFTKYYGA